MPAIYYNNLQTVSAPVLPGYAAVPSQTQPPHKFVKSGTPQSINDIDAHKSFHIINITGTCEKNHLLCHHDDLWNVKMIPYSNDCTSLSAQSPIGGKDTIKCVFFK